MNREEARELLNYRVTSINNYDEIKQIKDSHNQAITRYFRTGIVGFGTIIISLIIGSLSNFLFTAISCAAILAGLGIFSAVEKKSRDKRLFMLKTLIEQDKIDAEKNSRHFEKFKSSQTEMKVEKSEILTVKKHKEDSNSEIINL